MAGSRPMFNGLPREAALTLVESEERKGTRGRNSTGTSVTRVEDKGHEFRRNEQGLRDGAEWAHI